MYNPKAKHCCSVVGCTDPPVSLHRLPTKEDIRAKWLHFTYQGNVPASVSKSVFVCANHFTPDCFNNQGQYNAGLATRLFLKDGSIPTVRVNATDDGTEVFDNLGMYTSGMAAHLRLSEDAIPSVYTVGASPPVKLSNMGRKCAYPECNSTEGLHSMPSNREVAHRWLHALGRVDIPSASVYVCNLHFTRECFSNYAEVEMGFKKQLLLNPDAVPTPAKVVTLVTAGSSSKIFPAVRHVACQTDLPERLSVGTQVYLKTYFRSKGTQSRVASRDCGMCTLTFPLDSPLLFLQPTIVKRPSKRPRLSLTDKEEGPSQCKLSVLVHEPEDST